uniref:Sesquipedalian n=1 Tax=Crocodylus porosus TaxID=8502 RepID=A0A7M4F390_CROPO
MKLNERSLAFYATCDSPADNAGFLYKKGERHTAYHKRWFVLKGNMLFYFEEKDSREPVGVIILEGCTVELCEAAEEFAFAIKFGCAKSRTYILAAESQAAMESWVKSLSRASFDYMRLVVKELEKQLEEMQWGLPGCRRPPGPSCPSLKENGCAVWNNPRVGPKPPPLPPRRRASSGSSRGTGPAAAESRACPGTASFSKLHDWYGREIVQAQGYYTLGTMPSQVPCHADSAPTETSSKSSIDFCTAGSSPVRRRGLSARTSYRSPRVLSGQRVSGPGLQ